MTYHKSISQTTKEIINQAELVVFDFDKTMAKYQMYPHKREEVDAKSYLADCDFLFQLIERLINQGKKLGVASYNSLLPELEQSDYLGGESLVRAYLYDCLKQGGMIETEIANFIDNHFRFQCWYVPNCPKSVHITALMGQWGILPKNGKAEYSKVVFFDDDPVTIDWCRTIGISAFHVPDGGLTKKFYCGLFGIS